MYKTFFKRCFDIVSSGMALLVLSPILLYTGYLVKTRLGSPVLFTQIRPGKNGKLFRMYKFRSMTDERDAEGNLLPDDVRLTEFGKKLRATSADELPELINIFKGDMSVVGPRPQLVRDMVFFTEEEMQRQSVYPGLTGLAQICGRNNITWKEKFAFDLQYIKDINFFEDMRIIFRTVFKVSAQEDIATDGMETAEDYGDWLLRIGQIGKEEYDKKQAEAKKMLDEFEGQIMSDLVSIIMPSYNTAKEIEASISSIQNQTYENWELIIVDDCSTDDTDEVVKRITDKRIKYMKNEKNSGAAVSRNRALREAKGRWIAFLDSDDLWLPEKLEKQIKFMEDNNYKFSFTDYKIVFSNGEKSPYKYIGPNVVTKSMMWRYCYFSTITVMYDREAIGLVQIADIKKNNDYAMWLKIIEKANCYRYPEVLSIYCKRENSISSGSKLKLIKHHYIMFRKACGLSVLSSLLHTVWNLMWGVHKKLYYREKI